MGPPNSPPVPPAARDRVRRGVVLALGAGVLLGVTVPFAKRAFAPPMPPLFAAAWLYVCAGLAFAPFLLARPPARERRLTRVDLRFVLAAALLGCVAAPFAYVRGLALLPAHVVALLVNLEAVFGVLVAVLLFRERMGRRRVAGIVVLIGAAVATALLATRGDDGADRLPTLEGALWIAGACLVWAFDTNLLGAVSTRDPRTVLVVHNLVGGSVAWIASGCLGAFWPGVGGGSLALGAAVGIAGYGASLWLILEALAILGAARTNVIFLVTSAVTAVAASALVLDEAIPLWILGSLAAILVGVRLVASEGPRAASRRERDASEPSA